MSQIWQESLRSAVVDDVPLDWLGGRGASITGRWSEAAEVTQSKATILVRWNFKANYHYFSFLIWNKIQINFSVRKLSRFVLSLNKYLQDIVMWDPLICSIQLTQQLSLIMLTKRRLIRSRITWEQAVLLQFQTFYHSKTEFDGLPRQAIPPLNISLL